MGRFNYMNYAGITFSSFPDLTTFISLSHRHFAKLKATLSFNPLGISFPHFTSDKLGLVVGIHGEAQYLSGFLEDPCVANMIKKNHLILELFQIKDDNAVRWVAFKRNRSLERGSPRQSMKRMSNSSYQHAETRAKFTLERYFKTPHLTIPIPSKAARSRFSLVVEPHEQELTDSPIDYRNYRFNAYGLSASSSPVFLPVQ